MAVSTYTELKTAVAEWLHRGDLTARVPDFIQIGESVLNRRLHTVDMEAEVTSTLSTTVRTLALPAGHQEMISIWIVDPWQEIVYADSSTFNESLSSNAAIGTPSLYTIKDNVIEFNVISQSAYSVKIHYVKKYDIAADSTNWLLTNHPNAYLAASILAAQIYIVGDERLPLMKQLLDGEIREINNHESLRRGVGYLRADAGLVSAGGFNINTDN